MKKLILLGLSILYLGGCTYQEYTPLQSSYYDDGYIRPSYVPAGYIYLGNGYYRNSTGVRIVLDESGHIYNGSPNRFYNKTEVHIHNSTTPSQRKQGFQRQILDTGTKVDNRRTTYKKSFINNNNPQQVRRQEASFQRTIGNSSTMQYKRPEPMRTNNSRPTTSSSGFSRKVR